MSDADEEFFMSLEDWCAAIRAAAKYSQALEEIRDHTPNWTDNERNYEEVKAIARDALVSIGGKT